MLVKRLAKFVLRIIGVLLLLFVIYGIAAYSLPYISVNSNFSPCEKDAVEIYIKSNGVHVDLVLPVRNEYKDWSNSVSPLDIKSPNPMASYIAIGWGDKGFYLQTKTWDDLKFTTAFKALFYLSSSAMHVTFYDYIKETELCKKVCISKVSYQKLIAFIENSFATNASGKYQQIKGASYWNNDGFYEAKGTYSLFNTCNTWTNNALKASDLKACLWTPFDKGILYQYRGFETLSHQ